MRGKHLVGAKMNFFGRSVPEHAEDVVSILPTPFMYIYTFIYKLITYTLRRSKMFYTLYANISK